MPNNEKTSREAVGDTSAAPKATIQRVAPKIVVPGEAKPDKKSQFDSVNQPDALSPKELAENHRRFGLDRHEVAVRVKPGCGSVVVRQGNVFDAEFTDEPKAMDRRVYETFIARRQQFLQLCAAAQSE